MRGAAHAAQGAAASRSLSVGGENHTGWGPGSLLRSVGLYSYGPLPVISIHKPIYNMYNPTYNQL